MTSRPHPVPTLAIAVAIGLALCAASLPAGAIFVPGQRPKTEAQERRVSAKKHKKHHDGACDETAANQWQACQSEARDDYYTERATCINRTGKGERDACFADAKDAYAEAGDECAEQQDAREELCDALGQDRYDPSFDPADFDADFDHPTYPNPYFPLAIGNRWVYGGAEDVTVEVKDATKSIEGVTCIVVNDRVEQDGVVAEDTDDWFGLRLDGGVDYCGESTAEYELFPGDQPPVPERVEIEGSWKTGRDGAKPGTLMLAVPVVGKVYRQEWLPGTAEDGAEVLSTTYAYGSDAELDELVPPALAQLLCAGDCVVTGEFTPIEPDAFERKYYAPGIGVFLEVSPEDGDVVQLVECNFDARCAALPSP